MLELSNTLILLAYVYMITMNAVLLFRLAKEVVELIKKHN